MPHYREYFDNSSTKAEVYYNFLGRSDFYPLVTSDAVVQGFRAKPHSKAKWSTEVSPISADPYAYFLQSQTTREYKARLAERNLPPEGEPDRGHPYQVSKYDVSAPIAFCRYMVKEIGSAENMISYANVVPVPSSITLGISGAPGALQMMPNPVSSLSAFAQQAYTRAAPTAVIFDAANFLGELREGLPRLSLSVLKDASKFYKGLGSDYLNVEFGWKPFINDLIKMGKALQGHTDFLSQQGKRVHRRLGAPPIRTSHESSSTTPTGFTFRLGNQGLREPAFGLPTDPLGSSNVIGLSGNYSFIRTMERQQWFEGEFTNFMPLGFDPTNYLDRLNQLINVKLTPETLWNLAPWSWLVDWNLRLGDTIKANQMAANNKLIMHYGYAMEHTILRDVLSLDFSNTLRSQPGGAVKWSYFPILPEKYTAVATTEYKRRIRANPYGFNVGGTSALNSGQLAILGALGLTRLK